MSNKRRKRDVLGLRRLRRRLIGCAVLALLPVALCSGLTLILVDAVLVG